MLDKEVIEKKTERGCIVSDRKISHLEKRQVFYLLIMSKITVSIAVILLFNPIC